MSYISILGHQTWASTGTDRDETVVLLHGGLSNSDLMLDTIGRPLAATYRVAAFDRRGHGRTADTSAPFHYAAMADETIAFLEHLGGPAHLIGWSDGGNVGLLVALRRPDLVGRLVTIGSNYDPDGLRPMTLDPDSPTAEMLNAQYGERSPDGPEHFGEVVGKSLTMFASEPQLTIDDLRKVSVPVLVMVGDDDSSIFRTPARSTSRSPRPSSPSCPALRTPCQWSSPRKPHGSSNSSSPPTYLLSL